MNTKDLMAGAAIGAALEFIFDPYGGSRRRALVRDKVAYAARKTRDGLDGTDRDVSNRAQGIVAATRGRLRHEDVDDATLVERVRARLGRVSSHPRAIDVEPRDGEVTLRGPILAEEVDDVVAATASVRGVQSVVNELEPHESSDGVPSLQGRGRTAGPRLDVLPSNWAPATRALVSAGLVATGLCMVAYARR